MHSCQGQIEGIEVVFNGNVLPAPMYPSAVRMVRTQRNETNARQKLLLPPTSLSIT